ncbi:MAG: hypothetical protein RLY66_262 [Candidatus Parcubacteria bacterium]|jgi:hypothetical protein
MYTTAWSIALACSLFIETMCACESTNLPSSEFIVWTPKLTQNIPSKHLTERWCQEIAPAGNRIVYSRYGIPSEFFWIQAYDVHKYGIYDYSANYGRETVFKIMGNAAREAALQTLPVDEFIHDGQKLGATVGNFFVNLAYGSLGNPEEEDVKAVSATPTYSTLKYIVDYEWNKSEDVWSGKYGWRPWRDNPYAYLDMNLGHYCGRQFIRFDARCYGYLRPNSFGLVKSEASAIVTLSDRSQLVFGGFIYPFENDIEHAPQASVRFETYWRKSLISLGVASSVNGPFWNATVDVFF